MKNEYIIINKTAIQKRIEELEKELPNYQRNQLAGTLACDALIKQLKQILSQSTPLIPEIEKAYDASRTVSNYKGEWKETYSDDYTFAKYETSKDYISNLKLDI